MTSKSFQAKEGVKALFLLRQRGDHKHFYFDVFHIAELPQIPPVPNKLLSANSALAVAENPVCYRHTRHKSLAFLSSPTSKAKHSFVAAAAICALIVQTKPGENSPNSPEFERNGDEIDDDEFCQVANFR